MHGVSRSHHCLGVTHHNLLGAVRIALHVNNRTFKITRKIVVIIAHCLYMYLYILMLCIVQRTVPLN